MAVFKKLVTNAVFGLQILLLFLVFFRAQVEIPMWLQILGRMHPLLLHLPIGFFIFVVLLEFFRSEFKKKSFSRIKELLLSFTALTASLTALMGLFLSLEGGYEEDTLQTHLNTGTFFSFFTWGLLLTHRHFTSSKKLYRGLLYATTLLVILTGHFGATLTHGDSYLLQPLLNQPEEVIITDSTSLFTLGIQPILKAKCASCHNERKAKGKLILTSVDHIQKGGENGPVWAAGNPDSSGLMQRLLLPEQDDDHMPPSGKPQLQEKEIELISKWIASGADYHKAWSLYNDTIRQLVTSLLPKKGIASESTYSFSFASLEAIEELNTPYCTVKPLASDVPALVADFYLSSQFTTASLAALSTVKYQLVQLNLAGMPVTDQEIELLLPFVNLERINLNNTQLTSEGLTKLLALKKLQSLSLNGTAVEAKALESLAALPDLKSVFVWNTSVGTDQLEALRKKYPAIHWDEGYMSTDKLRLTPPLLVNEQFILDEKDNIVLKHNLPGTEIVYTLDGSEPDSLHGMRYTGPVAIQQYSIVKARAVKEGWFASNVIVLPFFRMGMPPAEAELLTKTDKDYRAEGAKTLINGKKGDPDNYRDNNWLAFRQNPGSILFTFHEPTPVRQITVGYNHNIGSYLMPPASVEVWGGNEVKQLRLLRRIAPLQPSGYEPTKALGLVLPLDKTPYTYFKIIVTPVPKLPSWHGGKGEKGWVFLDEVIFEQ